MISLKKLLKIKNSNINNFALETHNEKENAKQKKLVHKNLNAIVLNSLNDAGAGFGYDTNKVTIIIAEEERTYQLKKNQKRSSCRYFKFYC